MKLQRELLGVRPSRQSILLAAIVVVASIIFLIAVPACGDNTKPCLDAAVDAPPDATIKDWRWAFTLYAKGWCELQERCDPAWIANQFGTVERCTQDEAALCDAYIGIDKCNSAFPSDRYATIMQCETDEAALDCSAYPDVPSCDLALVGARSRHVLLHWLPAP